MLIIRKSLDFSLIIFFITLAILSSFSSGSSDDSTVPGSSTENVVLEPVTAPIADILGAPSGVNNLTNLAISIGGNGVVASKYKLDDGAYSDEIPVISPINLTYAADVTISGKNFTVGNKDLQNYLDDRSHFIDSVTFSNVEIDSWIVFLLNPLRAKLQNNNRLYIDGSNIDQLDVHMNNSPTVPATVIKRSLTSGTGDITYDLKTDNPSADFIRISNNSRKTASFIINLNNKLFTSDAHVINEILAMSPEYEGEPLEIKVWRFIRDNRHNWHPLTDLSWMISSPALFFNSIGFGYCDDSAMLFCQLMTSFGYQTRFWCLSGHVVPEVLINGKWEMYDADLGVYYHNFLGDIVGVEELETYPDLITNPIYSVLELSNSAYSQDTANIYSSTTDNSFSYWDYDYTINNYSFNIQLPSGGILEFPYIFSYPPYTLYGYEASSCTNARLIIPSGWSGTISTPLVIHTIGQVDSYAHTLSVLDRDSAGNYQREPAVAQWTLTVN